MSGGSGSGLQRVSPCVHNMLACFMYGDDCSSSRRRHVTRSTVGSLRRKGNSSSGTLPASDPVITCVCAGSLGTEERSELLVAAVNIEVVG